MRKLTIIVAAVLVWALFCVPAFAAQKTYEFKIPDLCASNAFQVSGDVGALEGVVSVTTDVEATSATVVFDDDKTGLDAINAILEALTLPASEVNEVK